MCHSATARPTHEVVVGRAVFVMWNPPTTARSRTRTGFVFCFFPFAVLHQPNRRGHRDIRVMCHSSSDVLARPRRPPPESSVESSAPESAKFFCEWQSRAESSTRVLRPSPSPPGSSRRPRQSRPKLFWSPTRLVRSLSESPDKLSKLAAVIRRPCQSRPLSVPESGQECRSSSRPRSFARYLSTKLFLGCPSSSKHSRPPSPSVRVARRPRQGLVRRLPARVARRPRQGRPPSRPPSPLSAVPARVARRPRQRPPSPRHSRPPSAPGSPSRVVRRPRQDRAVSPARLVSPPESSAKSPPL